MNKYVVYTAIFNNYDLLKDPGFQTNDIDFICFTDNKKLKSKQWKIIHYDENGLTPSQMNRKLKILGPCQELKEYGYSIYIDGSIQIIKNLMPIFNRYSHSDLINYKHYARNCLYKEIDQCIVEKRGNHLGLLEQKKRYLNEGMPLNFSLSDNTIIFRAHSSDRIKNIMVQWYNEVINTSGRDQVSLPYILWKNKIEYIFFPNTLLESDYFEIGPHRKEYLRRAWRFIKRIIK